MRGNPYSVKGDPYWLRARFPKKEGAFYWPKGKRLECAACGETSERRFQSEVQDEITSGGWS
jgi:hypothetical protein